MSMKQIRLVSHLSMSMGLLLKIKEMFPGPEKGCSGVRLELTLFLLINSLRIM